MQPNTEQTPVIHHSMHTAITLPEAEEKLIEHDGQGGALLLPPPSESADETLNMMPYKPFSLPSRCASDMMPRVALNSTSLSAFLAPDGVRPGATPHHLLPGSLFTPSTSSTPSPVLSSPGLLSAAQSFMTPSPEHPFYPLLAPMPPADVEQAASGNIWSLLGLLPLLVGTAFVLLLYALTPLTVALWPFLPALWSRLLIALELFILVEWLICRILYKTTKR